MYMPLLTTNMSLHRGRTLDQLKDALARLKLQPQVQASLLRLGAMKPMDHAPWTTYTKRKSAAVLVLLQKSQDGGRIEVLLTTRALHMRNFPGETALPGGRVDETDASIDSAALREAEEEVGLNASTSPMLFLTALPPVPSRNLLCVFPCVYFLASNDPPATLGTLKPNPDEVENIFQAPLDTFVSGNTTQHSFRDVDGFMGTVYRLHSFDDPSFYSPVTGMTAEVLIRVAMAAFDVQELPFALIGPRGKPSGELATKLAEQHRAETESMKQPGRSKV